jgi:methyl-CpG-binding domain protein 4
MEKLIQEDYVSDPWKMLVCCILLNQTTNQQVRKVLDKLFALIPTPEKASEEKNLYEIETIIKSTGFSKIKSQRILKMSQKWISGFKSVRELPGVGKYASDSWEIFINRNLSLDVTDKKLKLYLEAFNHID